MNEDARVIIKVDADTSPFDKKIDEIKSKEYDRLDLSDDLTDNLEEQTAELEKQGKTTTVLQRVITKLASKFTGISQSTLSIGKNILEFAIGFGSVVGIVGVIALAIGGIVGALADIISKDEELNKDWEELKVTVQYLWFALKQAFTGIAQGLVNAVKWLINAFKEIITFIARIIFLITGYNIFKSSGIDDFKKSLDGSNKSAKELKKTLAGFDEMNVLNDDGSVNQTGGAIGGLSALGDIANEVENGTKIEKKIQDLIDKWFTLGKEMGNALDNPEVFKKAFGLWGTFMQGVTRLFSGIHDIITGFVEAFGGLLDIIVGLVTLDGQKIWNGVKFVADGIWKVIQGLIKVIIGIVEMIAGLIIGIVSTIAKVVIDLCNAIGKYAEIAWNVIKGIFEVAWGFIYNKFIRPVGDMFANLWNGFKDGAVKAWEGIKSVFSTVGTFFRNTFKNAWEGVKNVFSTGGQIFVNIKDAIVNAFKVIVNSLIRGINNVVSIPFNAINNALQRLRDVDLWGWKPFESIGRINVPQIPYLAKGGIVNMPGKGVPVGGAMAGEQRPEAVLPFSDSQVMSMLGAEIGKNVNLVATIPVYVGNRQVAREIKRINLENEFAGNR